MKDAPGTRDYDWWLIAILAAICALGVVEIYSATHASNLAGMHIKRSVATLRLSIMFILSRIDYHLILDQALILYVVCLAALAAVLVLGGSRFVLNAGFISSDKTFQVSELAKLIIIIALARFFAEVRSDQLDLRDLLKAGMLVGVPLA